MQLPVVYVHGFIGHMGSPELRAGLDMSRVLAPDLLGYGRFADASLPLLSITSQARHLRECIECIFGTEPVLLVGHSAGAAVCIRYAQAHPDRVAALVSAEGNLAPSDAFLSSRLAPMTLENVHRWLAHARAHPRAFLTQARAEPTPTNVQRVLECLQHQEAPVIHAMARAVLVETVLPTYAAAVTHTMTHLPTYLVRGERSAPALVAPPAFTKMAAGQRAVAGAGHLMIIEAPEAFAQTVLEIESGVRNLGRRTMAS